MSSSVTTVKESTVPARRSRDSTHMRRRLNRRRPVVHDVVRVAGEYSIGDGI